MLSLHRWFRLFSWLGITAITVFTFLQAEIPVPGKSLTQGNDLLFFEKGVDLKTYEILNEGNSSIRYFPFINEKNKLLGYSLWAVVSNQDSIGSEIIKRFQFPLAKIALLGYIRIPTEEFTQMGIQRLVVSFQTDAPAGTVGFWGKYASSEMHEREKLSLESTTHQLFRLEDFISIIADAWPRIQYLVSFLLVLTLVGFFIEIFLPELFGKHINDATAFPLLGLGAFVLISNSVILIQRIVHKIPTQIAYIMILCPLAVMGIYGIIKKKVRLNLITLQNPGNLFTLVFFSVLSVAILNTFNIVPPWVDGLKHAEIIHDLEAGTRSVLLSGYHTGFHTITVTLRSLTNLPVKEVILLTGMTASVLTGLAMYVFCLRVTEHPGHALIAGLVFSLVSPFPLYLLNWSRYSLIMATNLLLPLFGMIYDFIFKAKLPNIFSSIILTLSAVLVHYSSVYLIFLFTAACLLSNYFVNKAENSFNWRKETTLLILLAFSLAALLALFSVGFRNGFLNLIRQKSAEQESLQQVIQFIFKRGGLLVLIAGLAGIFIHFKSQIDPENLLLTFFGFLLLGQLIQRFLLGTFIFSLVNTLVILFLVLSYFAGKFLSNFVIASHRNVPYEKIFSMILALSLGVIGLFTAPELIRLSNLKFTTQDEQVLNILVDKNMESTFLINTMTWGDEIVPSDAGGWITYWTGIRTIYPTVDSEKDDLCDWLVSKDAEFYYDGGSGMTDYQTQDCIGSIPIENSRGKIFTISYLR